MFCAYKLSIRLRPGHRANKKESAYRPSIPITGMLGFYAIKGSLDQTHESRALCGLFVGWLVILGRDVQLRGLLQVGVQHQNGFSF